MNSIEIIRTGRESYYSKLGRDDYYTAQPDPKGVFLGQGAQDLQIAGNSIEANDTALKNLFAGFSPDGTKCLRRGADQKRASYTLVNPQTKEPVTTLDTFHLSSKEVEQIRLGSTYSKRLQTVVTSNGITNPKEWLKKAGRHFVLTNPTTGEKVKIPKVYHLSGYEVNQIKNGRPDRDLQAICSRYGITDLKKWLHVKHSNSVVAYDNVLSAPKDVSILWALAPNAKTRGKIIAIHNTASREAMKYLEKHSQIRKGQGGNKIEPAKAIFAMFTHTTSRAKDPQLHNHLVQLNIGLTKSGSGALDGREILAARYASGMIYLSKLRRELEASFGVKTFDIHFSQDRGKSFGIDGIPQVLRKAFSKRSVAIKSQSSAEMSDKEKRGIVLKTRQAKDLNLDAQQLLSYWQAQGRKHNFSWNNLVNKAKQPPITNVAKQRATKELIVGSVTEFVHKKGAVSEHQLVSKLCTLAPTNYSLRELNTWSNTFKKTLLTKVDNHKTIPTYRLNLNGLRVLRQQTFFAKIKQLVSKVGKRLQTILRTLYRNKMRFLLLTGKISHKKYNRYVHGTGLPTTILGLRIYQSLGLISKRHANYRIYKLQVKQKPNNGYPLQRFEAAKKYTQLSDSIFRERKKKQQHL